ncbi:hypothetical protein CK219_05325 [Mesorhizobium sp. WSM4313]|nr:hypothetical protein CK219_05325 [Mesorhizobium sp. WSM4313]
MLKAVGGADRVTLVDVSALLRSLEEKSRHFKHRGQEESAKLVAGDIRVLEAMVPRLVAGHPPIPRWERGKAYQRGALIVTEGSVWKLINGDGSKRQDWETIVSAPAPAKNARTIEEEIADEIRHLAISSNLDAEEVAIEKRGLKRYQEAVKSSNLTVDHLERPVKLRQQLRYAAGLVEKIGATLRKRDERIEKLETDLKARFDDIQNRLVELAKANASALDDRFAAIEARAAKLESEPFDIDEAIEDSGRVVVRRFMRSGEVVSEKRHVTAAMVYRGIHSETAFYLPGDAVTRAGSLWVCRVECTGRFNGDFWILAVKKGRDGTSHE